LQDLLEKKERNNGIAKIVVMYLKQNKLGENKKPTLKIWRSRV
jgi:hypothetical protein